MKACYFLLLSLLLSAAAAAEKPNFVVLFVDDMGIDQIQVPHPASVYGYTGNKGTIKTCVLQLCCVFCVLMLPQSRLR